MLPSPAGFAHMVGALSISETMAIVVYGEIGLFSAPRVWWTFLTMGAGGVRILSVGGPKWRAERRPTETGLVARPRQVFRAAFDPDRVADFDTVRARSQDGVSQIADARPAQRFHAEVPESRKGLRAGHIPSFTNLPVTMLTQAADHQLWLEHHRLHPGPRRRTGRLQQGRRL
ncbi:MAG: hypothetical protein MO852_15960 [Candidatus Devosia euplotis]|nr:hypothetical protein [Candidatus Devosia euplotis]